MEVGEPRRTAHVHLSRLLQYRRVVVIRRLPPASTTALQGCADAHPFLLLAPRPQTPPTAPALSHLARVLPHAQVAIVAVIISWWLCWCFRRVGTALLVPGVVVPVAKVQTVLDGGRRATAVLCRRGWVLAQILVHLLEPLVP